LPAGKHRDVRSPGVIDRGSKCGVGDPSEGGRKKGRVSRTSSNVRECVKTIGEPSRVERSSNDLSIAEKCMTNTQKHDESCSKHEDIEPAMPAGGASVTTSAPNPQPTMPEPQAFIECPLPRQLGAPSFGGKDITVFL
jgi:hypothetical protein